MRALENSAGVISANYCAYYSRTKIKMVFYGSSQTFHYLDLSRRSNIGHGLALTSIVGAQVQDITACVAK